MIKFSRPVLRPLYAVLALCMLVGSACKKTKISNEEVLDRGQVEDISDAKLLDAAKKYYLQQKSVPKPDDDSTKRPIDFLVADWSGVKFTTNSAGERVIGVPLPRPHHNITS